MTAGELKKVREHLEAARTLLEQGNESLQGVYDERLEKNENFGDTERGERMYNTLTEMESAVDELNMILDNMDNW